MRHGYTQVKPREYIVHLQDEHCPLAKQARKEAKEHYTRGWERDCLPRGETLKKFGARLNQEQELLRRDGITIDDTDKKEHYLMQCYRYGIFSREVIKDWKRKPDAEQTYANAKRYFERKSKGEQEVDRLMGENAKSMATSRPQWRLSKA